MARKMLIAGNWKMNKLAGEVNPYFAEFSASLGRRWSKDSSHVEIVFSVPYTLFDCCRREVASHGYQLAAQNVHWEEQGAYTGEISPTMLKSCGINISLIGHSERRQFFAETDQSVERKFQASIKHGLKSILCVGETLNERERDQTDSVLSRQIRSFASGLTRSEAEAKNLAEKLAIAYEPVWAIGTGKASSSHDAQKAHQFIRSLFSELWGEKIAQDLQIIYGGSANPKNISEFLSMPDIDGALVGGASLKPIDFAQMVISGLEAV